MKFHGTGAIGCLPASWRARPIRRCVGAAGLLTVAALIGSLSACTPDASTSTASATPFTVPAGPGAASYTLSRGADGIPYLAWVEEVEMADAVMGHRLRASAFVDGAGWTDPIEVARGADWFVNWADRPSVVGLEDGRLAAHWLVRTGGSIGSYGIVAALSDDGGATWDRIFDTTAREDLASGYSGFLSFRPDGEGLLGAYLAPPERDAELTAGLPPGGEPLMTVRVTTFDSGGTVQSDVLLDDDSCSCCPVGTAWTESGPIVAFRDRLPGELRDISVARRVDGRWTEARPVHSDGWSFPGCPVNGPGVDAEGASVALAWFTAPEANPEIRLAFSSDGGASFDEPTRLNGNQPIGQVDLVLLDDGDAVVSWLEYAVEGPPRLLVRRGSPGGSLGSPIVVADVALGAAGGIPQLEPVDDGLLVVWRNDGRLVSAVVPVPDR